MAFVEDLTPFFDLDDFAVAAFVGGKHVNGLFDEEYVETARISGTRPVFVCASSEISTIAEGDAITVNNAAYTVAFVEALEPLVSRIILKAP